MTEYKARKEVVLVIFGLSIVIGTFAGLSYALSTDKAERIAYIEAQKSKVRDFVALGAPMENLLEPEPEVISIDEPTESLEITNLREVMHLDMSKVVRIKDELKTDIIQEVLLQSQVYKVDPKLVYSVLFTESAFRNNVKHNPTYVKKLKKKIQAIGMGGVVWEFWDSYLIETTSLTKKEDLKDWRKNIEATAAILAYLSTYKMHPKAKDIKENAAIRYYGLPCNDYIGKINRVYARL